jgi:hypothetical protein
MQEIIKRLTKQAGLTEEQSKQAISIISDFIVEKYPMLKGQIRNFLGTHDGGNDAPQVGGINLTGLG